MCKVWVLQEIENDYAATTNILAIFDCMPSEDALYNAGIRPTLVTDLAERSRVECNISECTYILDEYELTRISKAL